MKQRRTYVMYLLFIAALLLSSCAKSSKNAKFIPENAMVLSIDVKQIFEKSKLGNNEDAKKKLMEAIENDSKSKENTDFYKKIIEDPAKAGIDFREPIFAFNTDNNKQGVVGTILDKDDFTALQNAIAKEAGIDGVKEKDGIQYMQKDRSIIAFNDDVFFASDSYTLEEIVAKFKNDDTQNTMAESDDFTKLIDCKGFINLLFPMAAVEKDIDANTQKALPEGANIKDLSFLMSLTSNKGTATLGIEVLAKSDAWKKAIKKASKIYDGIDGDYLKYIPKGNLLLYTNLDGEDLYELLEKEDALKQAGAESKKELVKKVLESIDGDCAISISDFKGFLPNATAYLKTEDGTINDLIKQNGMKPEKGLDFGYKDGTTYFAIGETPAFTEAKETFDKSAVKGHRFYCYCDTKTFLSLASAFNRMAVVHARGVEEYVSSFEIYDTSDTSCDFVMNMKDSGKDPIEIFAELLMYQIR